MPRRQVKRFQTVAPTRAPATTTWPSCPPGATTIPAATVLATAVPVSAPTKFATAASRVRVSPSGMLDGDLLDDVGDVLAPVDAALEEGIDVLPLDDVDGLLLRGEEAGNGRPGDPVALVLEAVDLDPVALQALEAAQLGERLVDQLALLDDDTGLFDRLRGRPIDVVEDERVGRLLDEVEDVVEAADQAVDILAVEGRHKGGVEALADGVADLVALVLDGEELLGLPLRVLVGAEHRLQQARPVEHVGGILDEHVEEALFTGDEAETHWPQG